MQTQKKEKIKTTKKRKILLITLILFLVVLSTLLVLQFQEKSVIKKIFQEPTMYEIKDECGLLFNNILHEIKNSGECKISCINECSIRNKNFYDSNFIEKNNSCHTCNCYCK